MNRTHICNLCSLAVLSLSAGCATASGANMDAGLGSGDAGLVILQLDAAHETSSIIIVQMDSGQTIPPGTDATLPTTDGATASDASDATAPDATVSDTGTGAHDAATPTDAGKPADSSTPLTDSGVPTTCAEARNAAGCCAANGKSYYYCGTGSTTVTHTTCTGTKVCGWSTSESYYTCTATPGDAGSAHPSSCE